MKLFKNLASGKVFKNIIQSKVLLYFLSLVSILNVLFFGYIKDFQSVFTFLIVGLLMSFFSNNMIFMWKHKHFEESGLRASEATYSKSFVLFRKYILVWESCLRASKATYWKWLVFHMKYIHFDRLGGATGGQSVDFTLVLYAFLKNAYL